MWISPPPGLPDEEVSSQWSLGRSRRKSSPQKGAKSPKKILRFSAFFRGNSSLCEPLSDLCDLCGWLSSRQRGEKLLIFCRSVSMSGSARGVSSVAMPWI
jgi:hypothetical protein